MDNIVAPSLLDQNGGTQNNILSQMSNGIQDYLLKKNIIIIGDHLSGTLKKQTDFQLCEGLNQVETKPRNFSKNLSLEGNPRSGTLYSQSISPSPSLHVLETRYLQQRQGCLSNNVQPPMGLCFFTIFCDRPFPEQILTNEATLILVIMHNSSCWQ